MAGIALTLTSPGRSLRIGPSPAPFAATLFPALVGPPGPAGAGSFSVMTAHVDPLDGGLYIETEDLGDATPVFSIDGNGYLGVTL